MSVVNLNAKVLTALRADGFHAQVVERWDSFSHKRHDLFGIIDVLAIGHGMTIAVQVTSRTNMAARRRKMHESPELVEMLRAGWKVELWGYDKPAHRWRLKREMLNVTAVNA